MRVIASGIATWLTRRARAVVAGPAWRVGAWLGIDRSRWRHLTPEPAEGEFVSYYRCGRCRSRRCETEQEAARMIAAYASHSG